MSGGARGAVARQAVSAHLRTGGAPTSTERTCEICGIRFMVEQSQVKRGRGMTCSKRCHGKRWALRRARAIATPPVQIGTLRPGTRFKIETTEGEVVRQHRAMQESVVRFRRYGNCAGVRSVWPANIWVRVI